MCRRRCHEVGQWGELRSVSDSEIVQEEEKCHEVGELGELRSVSGAEIVQEEECREVGQWGKLMSVSDAEIVQEGECREVGQWGGVEECCRVGGDKECQRCRECRRRSVVKLGSSWS